MGKSFKGGFMAKNNFFRAGNTKFDNAFWCCRMNKKEEMTVSNQNNNQNQNKTQTQNNNQQKAQSENRQ